MKISTIAIALLTSVSSVVSAPVTENELLVRGKSGYGESSQVIIAESYETTETEILYSAHCDCDSCDYSVLVPVCLANHKTFYNEIIVDVNIYVVEIDKDTIYFKCKQPTEYVENTCGKHSFTSTGYPKGLLPVLKADSRSILLDLVYCGLV
jgi:uncharacterized pyridoxamine 5'-phosphate oxidase family protein